MGCVMSLPLTVVSADAMQQGASAGEWHYYGGDAGGTRYSPLDLINRGNVGELRVAWRWNTRNFGPNPEYNYRATPIMVDGVLYVTAGLRRAVAAIDAATGETLWTYRLDEGARWTNSPRLNSGRGVSYWRDGGDERIVLITAGYHLVALDAGTGDPVESFGTHGIVDLKLGFEREVDLETSPIGSSSPAMIVGDVIVVGTAFPSGSRPPSRFMPAGHVRGFDARTGEQLWIFHTIPQPREFGSETWERESWAYTGNAGVWTAMSADVERGYVYLPLEAPTGDYYGGHRLGDNLFSQSLVCLDARTGRRVWHFQFVHHGIWDYDLPTAPMLVDIDVGGTVVPAVAQVTKQAFTFVFNRITGEPVWPIEERPVPASDVPGERTSPTQPFPTKPAPFDRQGMRMDDLIDFTPALREEAIAIASRYRMGSLYMPPSIIDSAGTLGTLMVPSAVGGANWPGGAVDPETGVMYVQSTSVAGVVGLVSDPDLSDMRFVAGTGPLFDDGGGPQGLPLLKPPWGRITAIDLNTGEHLWMVPNGEAPDYVRQHPALQGMDLPRTGRPERGGLLVTKTLLFAGEGGGLYVSYGGGGPMLRAHDKSTGRILAEFELPANQTGLPMTYETGGRQFIVVAVGAEGHPAELVALTIP
jgi:quinoprotein glucose dehydrogenase